MEGNGIEGLAVLVLMLLHVNAIGVVRPHVVQCNDVQEHQHDEHDGQGHYVEGEEPVQGDLTHEEVPANPLHHVSTDHGDGAHQRHNHLRTPVGHIPPGQEIPHEAFSHEHQEDCHAKEPNEFPRLPVGAVHHAPEHVEVNHDEKRRRAARVEVAEQPPKFHVPHDVFDGGKGLIARRHVAHGEPDPREELIDQHHHGQYAKEIPHVEVLRRPIARQVVLISLDQGHAGINPVHHLGNPGRHSAGLF